MCHCWNHRRSTAGLISARNHSVNPWQESSSSVTAAHGQPFSTNFSCSPQLQILKLSVCDNNVHTHTHTHTHQTPHTIPLTCPIRQTCTNMVMYAWAAARACRRGVACGDKVASGCDAAAASSCSRTEPPGSPRGRCRGSSFCSTSLRCIRPCFITWGSRAKFCNIRFVNILIVLVL